MMKRNLVSKTLVGSLLLASLALAGCGSSTPAGIDDPYLNDPAYSDPGYTDPGYTDPGTGYTDPGYGTTPGTGVTPGLGYGAELSASVIKIKNGSFLGIGKCVATVEVMNPSQQQLTGTLTVTFTNKGKPVKGGSETKQVTVGPGESQTFTFENKKWSTDNATAEITTDTPVSTGGGYGTTPATGGYGGTTGGYAY